MTCSHRPTPTVVRTDLTPQGVTLLVCSVCDTVQCPLCDRRSGVFMSTPRSRCVHCHAPLGNFTPGSGKV